MKPSIYIVEDEPIIAETIRTCLENEGYTISGIADNAKEALFDIEMLQPDLVLVDITLDGDIDGIEMVAHLSKKSDVPFIFLTSLSDDDTLEKVKATAPSGYIVKPFNEKTLKTNIELALHKHSVSKQTVSVPENSDSFFIKNRGELIRVAIDEMLFLEAFDNYCYLVTDSQKLLITHTLKSVEEKLPENRFVRVHRSYVIQTSKIHSLHDGYVSIGRHKIPVGKSFRDSLMQFVRTL